MAGRFVPLLASLAGLFAAGGAAAADPKGGSIHNGLTADAVARAGPGGCAYRLIGFTVESAFVVARFHNGCGAPAVFNLCLRDAAGNASNRAVRAEGNSAADLGLGHESLVPDQRVRWTVDAPACPKRPREPSADAR
jgi:hypothetical protein